MADDLVALAYPRHVHFPSVPGDWRSRIVQTAEECAQALRDGGSLTPVLLGATFPPAPRVEGPVVSEPVAPIADPVSKPPPRTRR